MARVTEVVHSQIRLLTPVNGDSDPDALSDYDCDADDDGSEAGVESDDDHDEHVVDTIFSWREDIGAPFRQFPFEPHQEPGLQFEPEENEDPAEFVERFFDDQFWDLLVEQSNLYGEQIRAATVRMADFKSTDKAELKKFFALVTLMGITKFPAMSDYWSQDELFWHPAFSKTMSYNRFRQLMSCVHFEDNSQQDELKLDDPSLWKLRPLLQFFDAKMHALYAPPKDLSLDEALLKWRGVWRGKQYNAAKRARRGIELYEVTTPKGIVLRTIIHGGSDNAFDNTKSGRGYHDGVVMSLMRNYLDQGHSLYIDNRYTSPDLVRRLSLRQTHVTGTIRPSRRNLPDVFRPSQKGERFDLKDERAELKAFLKTPNTIKAFVSDVTLDDGTTHCQIGVQKWTDKRDVLIISNEHEGVMLKPPKLPEPSKGRSVDENYRKPKSVIEYNRGIGGVDFADSMISHYDLTRRGRKWYRKGAFRLIDLAINNMFLMFGEAFPEKHMSPLAFRKAVVRKWGNFANGPKSDGRLRATKPNFREESDTKDMSRFCVPVRISDFEWQNEYKDGHYKMCTWHSAGMAYPKTRKAGYDRTKVGRRTEEQKLKRCDTMWMCPVHRVYLCRECFVPWHNHNGLVSHCTAKLPVPGAASAAPEASGNDDDDQA